MAVEEVCASLPADFRVRSCEQHCRHYSPQLKSDFQIKKRKCLKNRASVSLTKLGFVSLESTVKNSMKTKFVKIQGNAQSKVVRKDTLRSAVTF